MFKDLKLFFAVFSGIAAGLVIGKATEYYTSAQYRYVKEIANQSGTGSATNILSGLAVGMRSPRCRSS
jgi:K(+)-stimulated pyrophosphate-energized sodium pump